MRTKIVSAFRGSTLQQLFVCSWLTAQPLFAQNNGWMEQTGGASNGYAMPWQSRVFEWSLSSHTETLTGSLSINRIGAGMTFAGFESHAQTLLAYGAAVKDYNSLSVQPGFGSLGLSAYHFISDGENSSRGLIDDSPPLTSSVTTYHFSFSEGQSAPLATVISLFDPGVFETNGPDSSRGPLSYSFAPTFEGQPVSTSDWALQVSDPYAPVGNSDTTHHWDSERGMLHINNYTHSLGASFPDNIAFVQTGHQPFDSLTIEVQSLASELVAIGITGPLVPVPEPSSTMLILLSGASFLLRRRRK